MFHYFKILVLLQPHCNPIPQNIGWEVMKWNPGRKAIRRKEISLQSSYLDQESFKDLETLLKKCRERSEGKIFSSLCVILEWPLGCSFLCTPPLITLVFIPLSPILTEVPATRSVKWGCLVNLHDEMIRRAGEIIILSCK